VTGLPRLYEAWGASGAGFKQVHKGSEPVDCPLGPLLAAHIGIRGCGLSRPGSFRLHPARV